MAEGLLRGDALVVNGLLQAVLAVVRNAELLLPEAATTRRSLLRVLAEHLEGAFLVVGCLAVDDLVDLVVEEHVFALHLGHLGVQVLDLRHFLAELVLQVEHLAAQLRVLLVAHVDGVDVLLVLEAQVLQRALQVLYVLRTLRLHVL